MPYNELFGLENLLNQLMGFTDYKLLTLTIIIVVLILIIFYLVSIRKG